MTSKSSGWKASATGWIAPAMMGRAVVPNVPKGVHAGPTANAPTAAIAGHVKATADHASAAVRLRLVDLAAALRRSDGADLRRVVVHLSVVAVPRRSDVVVHPSGVAVLHRLVAADRGEDVPTPALVIEMNAAVPRSFHDVASAAVLRSARLLVAVTITDAAFRRAIAVAIVGAAGVRAVPAVRVLNGVTVPRSAVGTTPAADGDAVRSIATVTAHLVTAIVVAMATITKVETRIKKTTTEIAVHHVPEDPVRNFNWV